MDIRKLLYRYKQLGAAKRTAEITITTIKERHGRRGVDENWWIRGSEPTDIVLSEVLHVEDTRGKIDYLQWVISELDRIVDAINRAVETLHEEKQNLIKHRYFDNQTVIYVCDKLNIGENKYHYMHRTSLEAMSAVLNPLCINDEYLDRLLFSSYGERLRESRQRTG